MELRKGRDWRREEGWRRSGCSVALVQNEDTEDGTYALVLYNNPAEYCCTERGWTEQRKKK